jgi:hypothetical protein
VNGYSARTLRVPDSRVATRGAGANAGASNFINVLTFSYLKPRRADVLRRENRHDDPRDPIRPKMLIHGRLCFDRPMPARE